MLVITDHPGWSEESKLDHMYLLQEKVNAYLNAILSGEIYEKYPKAHGRKVIIKVAMAQPMSEDGKRFSEKVASFVRNVGYKIEFEDSLWTHR